MHDPKYTADEQDLINDFVAEELISDFSPERKNTLMQLAANNIEQDKKNQCADFGARFRSYPAPSTRARTTLSIVGN